MHVSQLRDVVRVFSPPDPAPVLAGVKVVRPPGRSTLTPTRAGGHSHHEKPAKQPPNRGRIRLYPLTGPDLMGAETAVRTAVTGGFADTEEVTGSNPVAPTINALTSGNSGEPMR